MYYVSKRMEIAGAHRLDLPYTSKCSNLHGHNWIVTVYCAASELTEYGMVVDFTHIKKVIQEQLDHHLINDILKPLNPTAENMARWICQKVDTVCHNNAFCYKVTVQESEGNIATYEKDDI